MAEKKIEGLEQIEGSHVKMGGYIMLKGRPTKVTKVSFAKPGKHGHVKCNIVGMDLIIPNKKYQHMCPGHEHIEVPIVKKVEYVISYYDDDGDIVVLDDEGEETILKNLDRPIYAEIKKKFDEIDENGDDIEVVVGLLSCTSGMKGKYKTETLIDSFKCKDC